MAKVLLVDDEALIGLAAVATLEAAGHEVRYARHGKEALALLEDFTPDVLVTDLMMPIMDGRDLIEVVSSRQDPPPRIVLATAVSRDSIAKSHPELAAHTYLPKPFSDTQLLRAID